MLKEEMKRAKKQKSFFEWGGTKKGKRGNIYNDRHLSEEKSVRHEFISGKRKMEVQR